MFGTGKSFAQSVLKYSATKLRFLLAFDISICLGALHEDTVKWKLGEQREQQQCSHCKAASCCKLREAWTFQYGTSSLFAGDFCGHCDWQTVNKSDLGTVPVDTLLVALLLLANGMSHCPQRC